MTNQMIPKIDHSGVLPGYYEHKLNEVKSNKDLMRREYSKASTFAKDYVERMKRQGNDKTNIMSQLRMGKPLRSIEDNDLLNLNQPALMTSHHPSRSTALNRQSLPGLSISPIRQIIEPEQKEESEEGRKRSTSLTQSDIEFLENYSDSESEEEDKKVDDKAEQKAEPKAESKKKKDSKEEKEDKHNALLSSLTSTMLEEGIEILETEKKYYSRKPQNNVISKEGAKSLNKSLNKYGLNFRTGTKVATVVKKLEDHIVRLDNHYGVGKLKGQFADLKTNEEKAEHKQSLINL